MAAPAPASTSAKYTIEDLQAHKQRDNLWITISGKVYDVTKFLDEHPGGDEVLIDCAGRDATEDFEDVGHSDEARDMLPKMYKGELDGPAKIKTAAKSTGSQTGPGDSSSIRLFLPIAILGAWIAWRFFFA